MIAYLDKNLMRLSSWNDRLDRGLAWLFDTLPLRRVIGLAAFGAGLLNIADLNSAVANILVNIYGLSSVLVVGYMAIVAISGAILLFSRNLPPVGWFVPMVTFTMITPLGYLTGAFLGANSLGFGLKSVCSVGLLWFMIMRAIYQADV